MGHAFIIGVCVLIVGYRLFTGDAGRIALLAAVVVGVYVNIAQTIMSKATDALAGLGDMVSALGSAL